MRRAWIGERGVMDHWKKPSIKCYITIHYIRYHDYDYCLFIYIAVSICFGFVYMLFKFRSFRGASISSHGLLLSVNGSSLIPSVSVSFPGHIPVHNAWDEASDTSDNRVDNSINICIDSSDKHCRRSSLECASSIGVYTSTHRAGRWTEGEDSLLTLVHLPAEP